MTREEVVRRLEAIALLLELEGANPFEVAAFRNGARSLYEWEGDLRRAVEDGSLTALHGVGKGIAGVVGELVREGRAARYEQLAGRYPPGFLDLFEVPGLGLRKIKTLHAELGVGDLDGLEHAAASGAIRTLKGFGAKSEERIARGVAWVRRRRAGNREGS